MFQNITFISPPVLRSKHQLWATTCSVLDANHFNHKSSGEKNRRNWFIFKQVLNVMVFGVCALGLYPKGFSNSHNIQASKRELKFNYLPSNFDGHKILHLSILHLDATELLGDANNNSVSNIDFNGALLTGDFISGLWNYNNVTGYTSSGCGVSEVPLRFNCTSEITLFTLKSKGNNSV